MKPGCKLAAIAIMLSSAFYAWAQNPNNNPIQLSLLRWYPANIVTQFNPCSGPQGLAFDGSHIWVACAGSSVGANTLVEYDASDGTLVRTVNNVNGPYALIYDGANIWATGTGSGGGQVVEVEAATGRVLATVTVGSNPHGIAFDGTYIWVANYGSDSVTKILSSNATVTATYSVSANCNKPYGMTFDGTYILVVCFFSNNVIALTSTGTVQHSVTVLQFPTFIAYDGETNQPNGPFLWVTNNSSAKVSRISEATFAPPTNFSVGNGPYGVVFDGYYIWVANGIDNTVTKLTQATGAVVGTYPPSRQGLSLGLPEFMVFDGGNIWISNTSSGTVSKF